MINRHFQARTDPIAVARAEVVRKDGTRQTFYSVPKIPLTHIRRRLKLWRHLRFMKRES